MMTVIWIYLAIGAVIYAMSKIGLAISGETVYETGTLADVLVEVFGGVLMVITWPYQAFVAWQALRQWHDRRVPVMKVHFGTSEEEEEKP